MQAGGVQAQNVGGAGGGAGGVAGGGAGGGAGILNLVWNWTKANIIDWIID